MTLFRALISVFKILLWIPIVVGYLLTCSFWKIVLRDEIRRRDKFAKTVSFYSKLVLFYLRAELTVKNMPPQDQPALLVGNHLGIIDVLLLASVRPSLFITSVEMKKTPLLGTLCEMGGCVFVERRSRGNMNNEIGEIREALRQGFNVVLYPEGTSTNGEYVLPFKKSLMTAAAGTGVPILPMVLNYTEVNGEKMNWKWRDYVFWYGDHVFLMALWRMMSNTSIRAEIEFLEPIICHSEDERRHIAEKAQSQIEARFVKIPLGPGEVSTFTLPKYLQGKQESSRLEA